MFQSPQEFPLGSGTYLTIYPSSPPNRDYIDPAEPDPVFAQLSWTNIGKYCWASNTEESKFNNIIFSNWQWHILRERWHIFILTTTLLENWHLCIFEMVEVGISLKYLEKVLNAMHKFMLFLVLLGHCLLI